MKKYDYVYDYKTNDLLRKSFNDLARDIFSIDFEDWYRRGFWDDTYVCHSFTDNERIVSNVSVSKMHLLLNNRKVDAIQIGTVMTHPDYRNQGMAESLIIRILEEYRKNCQVFYLFPNKSVMNFYLKFGFHLTCDYLYTLEADIRHDISFKKRKLDVNYIEDIITIQKIITQRHPRSKEFDCVDSSSIFMWYCLNVFKDNIYVIDSEETIVICEINENNIELYDIVASRVVELGSVLGAFTELFRVTVTFHFTPDFSDIQKEKYFLKENEEMFVMPAGYLDALSFAHPIMAHT